MNRVAKLAGAGRSLVAKFHELRLKYWNANLDVICCFEGSDDIEFYLPRVRQRLELRSESVDFVNCGGKRLVLGLYEMVREKKWNLARLGFFVDSDLDFFVTKTAGVAEQLYVTDYYSIESYAITDDFFNAVWQESFRLSITDGRRQTWLQDYQSGAKKIAEVMLPFIATAVAFKRAGGGVDFDKVRISDFIELDHSVNVLRKTKRRVNWRDVFVDASPRICDVRRAKFDLMAVDFRCWLRGKYLLAYAMIFFNRMKERLGNRNIQNRAVVKAIFNADSALGCLCGRVKTSCSLAAFLQNWAALIAANGLRPIGSTT